VRKFYTPPNLEEVRKLVGAPDEYRLEVIMPIGYSADDKKKEIRKELGEMVFFNRWGEMARK